MTTEFRSEQKSALHIQSPINVTGRIGYVSRICRPTSGSAQKFGFTTIPCPMVVQQILSEILEQKVIDNFGDDTIIKIKNKLLMLPYWERCQCSPEVPPSVSEDELSVILALVPPHRFEVVYVTSSLKRSFVVGIESLIESVYRRLQLPQLRPCLQRSCEPSIGILKLDIARKEEKKDVLGVGKSKSNYDSEDQNELKLGSVLKMNTLPELIRNIATELHPSLVGKPKKTCIQLFSNRLSKEVGIPVFFQVTPTVTIRGITVTPDLYITLPEEGFIHLRCEAPCDNLDDDIMSYEQYKIYKKLAGIPCYMVKFESSGPHIRLVKNDDIFRNIYEAAQFAQIGGGMKLTKLAGPELREQDESKLLALFEKEFYCKLTEKDIKLKDIKALHDRKIVEIKSPSKMTVILTVEKGIHFSDVEGRNLLIKFGRREGPNFRFLMNSNLTNCLKAAAIATMQKLGNGQGPSKETYFNTFCEHISLPYVSTTAIKQRQVLFQKRENYIYIYSPTIAIVTIKKKGEHSNLLNVYKFLADDYKNIRGIPGLEIVFGTDSDNNFNLNYY